MENQRERLQPILEEAKTDKPQRQMTMEEFWRPIIQDEYSAVKQPAIEANNFELKSALITMVQQHQFTGHTSEDPNEHIGRFMRMANKVKLIKLKLFPFCNTPKYTLTVFDMFRVFCKHNLNVL